MMRIVFIFVFAGFSTACLSAADSNQRFERLDCERSAFETPLPNACQFAFEFIQNSDTERTALIESGATEIYAAELNVSLQPLDRYSVILSKWDGDWELSAFVGNIDSGFGDEGVYGREYRSVHFQVPESRVLMFKEGLKTRRLNHLTSPEAAATRTSATGDSVTVICLNGASLRAKHLSPNSAWSAKRQSCQGHGEIDEFADALFDLAIEFDPELAAYRFTIAKDDH